MKTVWKFPLRMADVQDIEIPRGALILDVQPQGDGVFLWALVESTAEKIARRICLLGTGHEAPYYEQLKHISTFQLKGGALVFHAFEIKDGFV